MALHFIAKDPNTNGDNCPTVWVDDSGEIVVQGWVPGEGMLTECLQTGAIPGTEAVVRLPSSMVAALREACDVAERTAVL